MSYIDADGKILAMEDTEVVPPWVVLESSKFKGEASSSQTNLRFSYSFHQILMTCNLEHSVLGRFYFFNNETKKHAWSLDPSIVNGTAGKSPDKTAGVENESSSRPRPSDLPRIEEKV